MGKSFKTTLHLSQFDPHTESNCTCVIARSDNIRIRGSKKAKTEIINSSSTHFVVELEELRLGSHTDRVSPLIEAFSTITVSSQKESLESFARSLSTENHSHLLKAIITEESVSI